MKDKKIFILKTFQLLVIIILYYIAGLEKMFLYTLSFSLYNILSVSFKNISFREKLNKCSDDGYKFKIFKMTLLSIAVISTIFILLSIIISDVIGFLLGFNNIWLIFFFMGFSVMVYPLVKVVAEYLGNINKNSKFERIIDFYYILDCVLFLVIAFLVFRVFKVDIRLQVAFLYLSKIISGLVSIFLMYLVSKKRNNNYGNYDKIDYYKEFRDIFFANVYKSIIDIIKNSYYYISIIVLYAVLSSRFGYAYDQVCGIITFIYFYGLAIINYLIYVVKNINDGVLNKITVSSKIYSNFKVMISLMIIFSVMSPLTCKLLFNNSSYSIYLSMLNMMAIFMLLYQITYESIKNKKVIYISLIVGIIAKGILIFPLINAFYRMGYNLVYGDILSSIIGMVLSFVINYIYIRNTNGNTEKYFEKILDILYDNIILGIILILLQFVIPINTDNYFKALGLFMVYILCIFGVVKIVFINLKRKKK